MKRRLLSAMVIFSILLGIVTFSFAQETVKIGVLAKNGPVKALSKWKSTDQAAKDAKVVGWTAPLNYDPVEDLQKKLNIGGYASK